MEKESHINNLNLLYSQLLQQSAIPAPSGNGLSFIKKKVKGHIYWYLQVNIGNRQTQRYIGPESPETQDKIEFEKRLWKEAEAEVKKRKQLVAMLQAGGVWFVSHNEARVFELMERLGFFLVGGVLLGNYAFNLYQNMLNVRWPIRTVNRPNENNKLVVHDLKMGISNQEFNLKEAVFHSGYGFFEVRTFRTKQTVTIYRFLAQEIHVEILTHLMEANSNQPVYLQSLNTFASPVKYLDFLLDDIQPAVIVARSGIRVNVPSPARYALYQLVLSQQQQETPSPLQSNNALEQAEQLLSLLIEQKTEMLLSAVHAAKERKDNFYSQMLRGIQHLPEGLQHKLRLNFFQNEQNRTIDLSRQVSP
jgi:hypothetical protein